MLKVVRNKQYKLCNKSST